MLNFNDIIQAVSSGSISAIEAERLLNAFTRANTNTPTGNSVSQNRNAQHTHINDKE